MKVGYARLSTGDPEGMTLAIQLDRLQAAGCGAIYSEVISGTARRRPEWERLKADIAAGRITEVVAVRMDRLSRSWTAIGEVIELFAAESAPSLTLLDDPLDLTTTAGRMTSGILSSVAAAERERIVARAKAGLRQRFASGRRIKVPFGLTTDDEGFPVLDRRPWLCTLAERRTWSRAEIATELWDAWEQAPSRYAPARLAAQQFGINGWGGGSAATWACNPALRGALTGGRRDRHGGYPAVQEDAFEALIDPERHLAGVAVFLRERASNSSRRSGHATPLSGKVICAACGYRMSFNRVTTRPSAPWAFRCRRIGCSRCNHRTTYDTLLEAARQHLLGRQGEIVQLLLGAFRPADRDQDLEDAIAKAQGRVQGRQQLLDQDQDDADLRRSLERAEAELAALQHAAATRPAPAGDPAAAMGLLGAWLSGGVKVQGDEVHLPAPQALPDPAAVVERMLSAEQFPAASALLVPALIHSIRAGDSALEVVGTDAGVLPMRDGQVWLRVPVAAVEGDIGPGDYSGRLESPG
ncbi:recombinase family protein [Synechococcus sp. CCAP 1479/9]|uniref:recombinase family protein n=1 Tax=Synechococcus sp. CCAP 1479/9 TaxID=1221593 RepID=UPI001C21F36A|nr:recombinase family protein [Synechococcus sp. CCAP 1479/9]